MLNGTKTLPHHIEQQLRSEALSMGGGTDSAVDENLAAAVDEQVFQAAGNIPISAQGNAINAANPLVVSPSFTTDATIDIKTDQADIEALDSEKADASHDTTVGSDVGPVMSDLDVVQQHLASTDHADQGAGDSLLLNDLQRLRDLVSASREAKAAQKSQQESIIPNVSTSTSQPQPQAAAEADNIDDGSGDMLKRALAGIGAVVTDSDSSEAESEEDEASESDSSSSSSELNEEIKKALQTPIVTGYDSDEDEEGSEKGVAGAGKGPTTKNEVLEASIDAPPYTIVPLEKEMRSLGKIHSIVDNVVVVAQETGKAPGMPSSARLQPPVDRQGRTGEQDGQYSVLDTGSMLCFEDRSVLGLIYETFGSVLAPLYALRYATSTQVDQEQIKVGKSVFYVPAESTYILTRALQAMGKGSDASNLWDEEIGDEEQEFSDDEAEAEHKRRMKAARSGSAQAGGLTKSGKGKKRFTNEAHDGGSAVARPIHALPQRPSMSGVMASHPDAMSSATANRTVPLPYDDDTQIYAAAANPYMQPSHGQMIPHVRPRGAFPTGRGRGGNRGHFAAAHGNPHKVGAVNPAFWTAGQSQQSYQVQPSYTNGYNPMLQQQYMQQTQQTHGYTSLPYQAAQLPFNGYPMQFASTAANQQQQQQQQQPSQSSNDNSQAASMPQSWQYPSI